MSTEKNEIGKNTIKNLKRDKLIREYLKTSGRDKKMEQAILNILLQIQKLIPSKDYNKLKKKYNVKNLSESFLPIFEDFSNDELQELIDFYKTPIGVKLFLLQDKLMADSTIVMQNIFNNMYLDIQKCQRVI